MKVGTVVLHNCRRIQDSLTSWAWAWLGLRLAEPGLGGTATCPKGAHGALWRLRLQEAELVELRVRVGSYKRIVC